MFTFCFFFFFESLVNVRQLPTRCSRFAVAKISKSGLPATRICSNKPSQFASSSALRFFARTSSSFLFASHPSLARFIFTALRISNASVTRVISAPCSHLLSSADFLLNERGLGSLTKLGLEGWVKILQALVIVWYVCRQRERSEKLRSCLLDDRIQLLSFLRIGQLRFSLSRG